MRIISVIVPIYHGKKYIQSIITQIEQAAKMLEEQRAVELILVNDASDESLDENYNSDFIDIVIMNTDKNRGIHGARVRGLDKSKGKYILFLDQDDKIRPEYFKSQLGVIDSTNDAVVCQVLREGKAFYNSSYSFEKVVNKEYLLRRGNSIITPGQVLIRKEAISDVWKQNIMKKNGADDLLLWLCMLAEQKKIVFNSEAVFEYIVHESNASWDSLAMAESERELGEIIKKNDIFSEEDKLLTQQMLDYMTQKRIRFYDKYRKMFSVLNKWMRLREEGKTITREIMDRGYHSIAIYGMGDIGRHLLCECKQNDIQVKYFIDRNAEGIHENICGYTMEETLPDVDVVIVTILQSEKPVIEQLKRKLDTVIITINELLVKAE